MKTDSDTLIVRECLAGNRQAFGMLVEKYEKKFFNTALRMLGDYEDAMDATQSAFVKAYQKLGNFDPNHRFFSWMYRTVLNESINILNKRKRVRFEEVDSGVTSAAKNPEEYYGDAERARLLQEALMELKGDNRAVVILKHYQGLSYKEISEIIGIPEKTVKSRLFTARRQLRDILARKGLFE